jgi:hypothetical protein
MADTIRSLPLYRFQPRKALVSYGFPMPSRGTHGFGLLDPGDDEIILGGEVLIECGLGHVCLGNDPVNANGAVAFFVEEAT